MKKVFAFLLFSVMFFSTSALALVESDFGWKPLVDAKGKVIGMSNIGEQGGLLAVSCNVEKKQLKMTYSYDGKMYDMFVFRKFGIVDMDSPTNAGKFIVGAGMTKQGDVYWNLMSANNVFIVARFPVGSKAAFDKALATKAPEGPQITQEGDENFIAGEGWKPLLKNLSVNCPVNPTQDDPIF